MGILQNKRNVCDRCVVAAWHGARACKARARRVRQSSQVLLLPLPLRRRRQVVLATVQTASQAKRIEQLKQQDWGLLIVDEAHHSTADVSAHAAACCWLAWCVHVNARAVQPCLVDPLVSVYRAC